MGLTSHLFAGLSGQPLQARCRSVSDHRTPVIAPDGPEEPDGPGIVKMPQIIDNRPSHDFVAALSVLQDSVPVPGALYGSEVPYRHARDVGIGRVEVLREQRFSQGGIGMYQRRGSCPAYPVRLPGVVVGGDETGGPG